MKIKTARWKIHDKSKGITPDFLEYLARLKKEENVIETKFDDEMKHIDIIMEDKNAK